MKRESKAERKFNLIRRITELGFTYEEAHALRRIEMTLSRWAEAECNGEIQRDEKTGRPYRYYGRYLQANDPRNMHFIADREAGALKRLKAIVDRRNRDACADRIISKILEEQGKQQSESLKLPDVFAYHQTDPRGCALYLVKASDLPETTDEAMRKHSGEWPLKSEETRLQWKLSCYYTRGLAVCA